MHQFKNSRIILKTPKSIFTVTDLVTYKQTEKKQKLEYRNGKKQMYGYFKRQTGKISHMKTCKRLQ